VAEFAPGICVFVKGSHGTERFRGDVGRIEKYIPFGKYYVDLRKNGRQLVSGSDLAEYRGEPWRCNPKEKVMATRSSEQHENMVKVTQLAGKYSRESPHKIATLVPILFSTAKKLHRYDLISTSERSLTPRETKAEEELQGTFRKVALALGATKVVWGDPRGYTAKVQWPGKESNDWGGEDWGIE
jgi:hypothetical protein